MPGTLSFNIMPGSKTGVVPRVVPWAGGVLTVMVITSMVNAKSSPAYVYDIVAVPVVMPVTLPLVLTVATELSLLLHIPPTFLSAKTVDEPIHTVDAPVIMPVLAVIGESWAFAMIGNDRITTTRTDI